MSLDVIDNDLQLGQLNLNDLRITIDRLQSVQSLVSSLNPDQQLIESMLELTQSEQSVLKLLLSDNNCLVQVSPALVNLSKRLLDSSSLIRRSSLSQIVGLSRGERNIRSLMQQNCRLEQNILETHAMTKHIL